MAYDSRRLAAETDRTLVGTEHSQVRSPGFKSSATCCGSSGAGSSAARREWRSEEPCQPRVNSAKNGHSPKIASARNCVARPGGLDLSCMESSLLDGIQVRHTGRPIVSKTSDPRFRKPKQQHRQAGVILIFFNSRGR